jgi:hypothetical protein
VAHQQADISGEPIIFMRLFYFLLFTFCFLTGRAQFAPQAGLPGSTAISASSSQFVGWATQCQVARGFLNIANKPLGFASAGDSSLAVGPSNGSVVSLGDSGVAIVTFAHPIYNGSGADFAVFENGFRNPADSQEAFLELAFVEVSSDGVNYFRFPATSNTQNNVQIPGSGEYMDARLINNLAGKYVSGYGTPFDLQELAGITGLDVNNIIAIRLVDVVGSIGAHASYDNTGRIINDPYPTDFPTGGFDLDAVGAIYQYNVGMATTAVAGVSLYPNPASGEIHVFLREATATNAVITNATGTFLKGLVLSERDNVISIAHYPPGLYFFTLCDANGNKWVERFVKY